MNDPNRHSFAHIEHIKMLESLYQEYKKDPTRVEESWRAFFEGMDFASLALPSLSSEESGDLRVYRLIEAYRSFGHLQADFNPIATEEISEPKALSFETLGFKESELDTLFSTFSILPEEKAPLRNIIAHLKNVYCKKIGIEFMWVEDASIRSVIQKKVERECYGRALGIEDKQQILKYLNKADLFEKFLHKKYVGQKRFSLEGGETMIPILQEMIEEGAEQGIKETVMGMAHRGRLNVLSNIFNRSYAVVFHEFEENYIQGSFEGSGDVKYHKGFSSDITTSKGKNVHLSIAPNTSHLESVNGIVLGQVRAKQCLKGDDKRTEIMPILIHGDASFAGQGIVYECMQLYKLEGYRVGGCMHLIIDNQVGFTTLPEYGRSTRYSSDLAKSFDCPVFHVNAEDPEGCILATRLAISLRQQFGCDVVIHLNCYRKYGHNEGDEPAYTQPTIYALIRNKTAIRQLYRDDLIQQGVLEAELANNLEKEFQENLQEAQEGGRRFLEEEPKPYEILGNRYEYWKNKKLKKAADLFTPFETGVDITKLKALTEAFTLIPEEVIPHKKVLQLFEQRKAALFSDDNRASIDWGLAEYLAYASVLTEGIHVRIAGQDARRGTFSHRHGVVVDQNTAKPYYPLQNLKKDQEPFEIIDSPLSEYACLGFEFGYSISYPNILVIWEAQFGDFANGAQIIIDGYIATAEQKWNRLSGLVMLLPHGYEGQGPEHSSARMERFLQLAGDNNMLLVNPSTPAQIFHLLRRQALQYFRKPLVVFSPKALLRHKECVSSPKDLAKGCFLEIIDDPKELSQVKTIVFCSGRVYYDLLQERKKREIKDMALIRIEQLYPFNDALLQTIVAKYKGFKTCIWAQEEPRNMGGWRYMRPKIRRLLPGIEPQYVGRKPSASPSTGSHKRHKQESEEIIKDLFEQI